MSYQQEKQLAIAAVTAAAKLCEQVRRERGSLAMKKPDRSPVTVADFGAQAVICQALGSAFPDDPIVAEENSAFLRSPAKIDQLALVTNYVQTQVSGATTEHVTTWIDRGNGTVASRYWTLDPIDGTKGYVRGDQYAIALALVEEGELKLGVLGCPALAVDPTQPNGQQGVIFVAVKDQGTTIIPLNGGEPQPIHITNADEVASQRLIESVEAEHGNVAVQKAVVQDVGLIAPSLRLDSMAKYGVVARGEAALYIRLPFPISSEKRQNIWDHAAGTIVLEEAGGRVTDMYGKSLDFACGVKLFNNQGIIASNGVIHDAVLAAVAERLKD
ncbi:MAG: 3'(2'),5'-bisphosphate nucleotidase [Symploca sp. SIO2C1]|nr:3'(2'),5'-bisphosphate nucleotidase [Symploca sp. SIO2C1]